MHDIEQILAKKEAFAHHLVFQGVWKCVCAPIAGCVDNHSLSPS